MSIILETMVVCDYFISNAKTNNNVDYEWIIEKFTKIVSVI